MLLICSRKDDEFAIRRVLSTINVSAMTNSIDITPLHTLPNQKHQQQPRSPGRQLHSIKQKYIHCHSITTNQQTTNIQHHSTKTKSNPQEKSLTLIGYNKFTKYHPMKNIKIKQPIHLGNNKKGKLRRIIRSKNNNESLDTQTLVVAPIHSQQLSAEHHNKQKHSFFLRKYETILKKENKETNETSPFIKGAFRAIHTADPLDSLKGFPLRSVTPIKPFRRGIRTHAFTNSKLDIDLLQERRPFTREMLHRNSLSMTIPLTHPEDHPNQQEAMYIPKYNQMQHFQQFYMYKESKLESNRKDDSQSPRVVAGTKISPFKKYHIRQLQSKLIQIAIKQ